MKATIAKYYQPFIVFILTLAIASLFSALDVDPHHHGIMLKPAIDVAHGQMLFRDTFTQYGALTTLLQAWALRIFGDYLIVIQIETTVFYGLIAVCLWYLWVHILPRWLTAISVAIWLFLAPYYILPLHPWSSVYALFFQLFSLLLVLRALNEQNRLMMMLAGCVAVLTFWCRQPVGVFHCASLVFFLATIPLITGQQWKSAMKDCVFFMAGIVTASIPFLVWLMLNSAIHDMYLQSIKAAFFLGTRAFDTPQSHNLFMKILVALFDYDNIRVNPVVNFIWSILPLVCLSLLAILTLKVWHNRESVNKNMPLYGLLVVSLASWMQYYPLPDIRHCYWAATPMIGLFSYGTWQLCSFKKRYIQIIIICLILVSIFGLNIAIRISYGYRRIAAFNTKIEEPKVLRGMYVTPPMAEVYKTINRSLIDALKENSFPYLVNLTWDPIYSTFISSQKNFHPMYIFSNNNDFIYPNFRNLRNEFISTKHPLVLWYEGSNVPGWSCVKVFNIIDSGKYILTRQKQKNRIALYRFTGSDKIP